MKKPLKSLAPLFGMLLFLSAFAGPVSASPPDQSGRVERFTTETGLIYDNGENVVITGPPFEEGCLGEGFPTTRSQVVFRGNDTFSETYSIAGINVMVFEYGGDAFDVIIANCDALAAGEDLVFEPIAMGEGRHSFKVSGDGDGVHIRNTLTAKVTTVDGARAHVNTFASFDDGPAGMQNLVQRINYTG